MIFFLLFGSTILNSKYELIYFCEMTNEQEVYFYIEVVE